MKQLNQLERITLIKSTRCYTYLPSCKECKLKKRKEHPILQVCPQFYITPKEELKHFETFFRSELQLYIKFQKIDENLGKKTKKKIINNCKQMKAKKYIVWHVHRIYKYILSR